MSWFLKALKKYAVLSGRARRKEFWYFQLFKYIIYFVLIFLEDFLGLSSENGPGWLIFIFSLLISLPSLAVAIRRLHDTGRSGWWYLLYYIPIIGLIILLIFFLMDSQPGDNKYGPNPKEREVDYDYIVSDQPPASL